MKEIREDRPFFSVLDDAAREFKSHQIPGAAAFGKKMQLQYAVVRAVKPAEVIETGVANGVSSYYLLTALSRNGGGTLHSVEIGPDRFVPKGKEVGWIVPQDLRANWHLSIGDSLALLPIMVSKVSQLDVFIHDSVHSYRHVLDELNIAYPVLRPGGIVVIDDVNRHGAMSEFCDANGVDNNFVARGVGFFSKSL